MIENDDTKDRVLEERNRFVASLSHSLAGPLATVELGIQSLVEGRVDEADMEKHLARLQRDSRWAVQRCRRLMKLAAWQGQPPRPQLSAVSLLEPLLEVLEVVEEQLLDKEIILSLGKDLKAARVLADPADLREIFLALFENVIEHSGGECEVSVEMARRSDGVEVTLSDTGEGADQAEVTSHDDLFTGKGAGLGLVVANKLLQAHGSQLDLTTRPGEGFSARFSLPKAD